MKKIYTLLFLLFTTVGFSQQDAWVYFNAKPNSKFYLDSPLEMLTQRALDRRTNQNISIDFKDVPVEETFINQVKMSTGITVMAKSKWMNAIHVRGSQANINSLALLSFVDKVDFADKSLNQTAKIAKLSKVKKVNSVKKTKIEYAYGASANQIQMLNGHQLHQQNYTGSGKIIAVLDGGFPGVNTAQPFQRLRANNQILGGYNFVLRDPDFYTGVSHGTLVLSSMGGYKENSLVGTAPDASYYLFITEDDTSENPIEESLWVEAAERADSLGVDIINTSLGYFDYDNAAYSHTYSEINGTSAFISRGAEIAYSRGMIVVASAGNSGGTSNPNIGTPADAVSVITVGAVNSSEVLTSFSSVGPTFDARIKPDVMAQGLATIVSDPAGNIVTANGTSFSSPIMAGMIACLWQAFPQKTNQEIRELVLRSSDKFMTPDNQYGYGIPDFALAISNQLDLESFSKDDFILYPNPASDTVSVSLPSTFDTGTVYIYSILGQKVLEQKITPQTTTISLKSLNDGVYLYKMESDGFSKTGKIIKKL
ncbi:S8 family peptidase [Flavobacterium glaciei]|uniref:Secreted protein (Por secretion system target) n=1 Tax=Flavobacterium glaciei TaxID=386300 RepID=A0A562PKH4_9FLAO|nr:S8 family serine peptidase [Flavobacterium glaciei]RDI50457.1 putative secreted protein (Por secretion system target) [Flavobacterium glaciei]TWI44710.1 putative secreted protein (Por secretion system target) [Flavobacterium glaciei]